MYIQVIYDTSITWFVVYCEFSLKLQINLILLSSWFNFRFQKNIVNKILNLLTAQNRLNFLQLLQDGRWCIKHFVVDECVILILGDLETTFDLLLEP